MRTLLLSLCLLITLLVAAPAQKPKPDPHVVDTPPLSPADAVKSFRLPPGFVAQLVAAEPQIQKPLNIAFDDRGRLWVTDTVEYPYPAKDGTKPRDTVKILSDFAPDGKARSITTFADGLNIPIGVLPLPSSAHPAGLVYSIPRIYKVTDGAGKGVADTREALFGTFGTADTHGMTNNFLHGYDGWVYACHGFANSSKVRGRNTAVVAMQSGNTYRMSPDGSRVEQVTWGQVNPFGIGFDERGYLYSSDCHSQPIYQLIREGYYPSFGKPHDGLGFAPEMFRNYKGSTAVAGLAHYSADAYPKIHRGSQFVGDVVTNQVVEFRTTWEGSTPKATAHVFMDCKDKWFRPVDVKLGPDGALYVADFYNRIIGHYEVPLNHPGRDRTSGRIWRIVYTGKDVTPTPAPKPTDNVKELAAQLSHPNMTVRMAATHRLAGLNRSAIFAVSDAMDKADVTTPAGELGYVHAMWANHRLDNLGAGFLLKGFDSSSELVRIHTNRVAGDLAKPGDAVTSAVRKSLGDKSPHVKRAAAEALARHPSAANVRPLMAARNKAPDADTHLVYGVRLALRNQLRELTEWPAAAEPGDATIIADVVLGVKTPTAAKWVVGYLTTTELPTDRAAGYLTHAVRYGSDETRKAALGFVQTSQPTNMPHRAALVSALAKGYQEAGVALAPGAAALAATTTEALLSSAKDGEVRLGIDLAGKLRLEAQQARLVELLKKADAPPATVVATMQALAAIDTPKHAGTLGGVLADPARPREAREQAAILLGRANHPAARSALLSGLATAPATLQYPVASALAGSREGAQSLLDAVAAGKASARLLQERGLVVKLAAARLPGFDDRVKKLTAGLPAADDKLAATMSDRRKAFASGKPDAARGEAVYTKHCAACHRIADKGAKVGPNLDGIGNRGLDRLLEDTMDPNRNVDQAFRTTVISTKRGQSIQGLYLREEGAVLVLADPQGKEVRVNKADVAERELSALSPMPANFAETIPAAEFADLLAYLLAQKAAGK